MDDNYKDTEPYMLAFLQVDLLTDFAAFCLTDFIDWRHIHSWLVFSTQLVKCCPPWTKELYLCTVAPLHSLWPPPPSPPSQTKCTVYTDSVCLWGGVGVLNCTVDHIQHEFYTLFLTRFRTYKIASPPQTKMFSKDDIKGLVSLKFLRPYLTLSHQITLQCVPHSTEELWLRVQSFQDCSATETHIQRQAALHICLPMLLGDGDT